ncbi:unnamed protein product [Paramecium octaurelia]|uniref:Uncharacterized protein n=1 Tax=Paramecium octaurelia TaxID=43137 RepID=A0A8S1UJK4_PAROT|nr:unnamed protein product [Paramecium octaurelia]
MKEFLFKIFKTINHLLKARKNNKIIYIKGINRIMTQIFYSIYGQNIGNSISNPTLRYIVIRFSQQFITKDQFVDFLLLIGFNPDISHEAERFFDYCHEDVVTAPGLLSRSKLLRPIKNSKWFRLFKD